MKLIAHKDRIAKYVRSDAEAMEKLFEPAPEQCRTGPSMPPYAEAKQKKVMFLYGMNCILIDNILSTSNEGITNVKKKETYSSIVNRLIEHALKTDPDLFFIDKEGD